MTDVETTLREGLQAFAAATSESTFPPATASISLRARTPVPTRARWPKVAVVVAGSALITTGVASAAGVLPGPVESMVREFRSWGFDTDGGAAQMATVTDGDFTYEVWVTPLEGGGHCTYDRVVGPDGDVEHGGASACLTDRFPATGFRSLHYPDEVGGRAIASGQLPVGATRAEFQLADGTTVAAAGQTEGWFITAFRGARAGTKIVAVRALDADGRITLSLDVSGP